MKAVGVRAVLLCCIGLGPQSGVGQTIRDGVYSSEQAEAGSVLYREYCQHCHDLEFYRNSLRSWTDMTLLDYWYRILGNMPADRPKTLSNTQYLDVVAYILSVNGFPAGDSRLSPSNLLGKIKIVPATP